MHWHDARQIYSKLLLLTFRSNYVRGKVVPRHEWNATEEREGTRNFRKFTSDIVLLMQGHLNHLCFFYIICTGWSVGN